MRRVIPRNNRGKKGDVEGRTSKHAVLNPHSLSNIFVIPPETVLIHKEKGLFLGTFTTITTLFRFTALQVLLNFPHSYAFSASIRTP